MQGWQRLWQQRRWWHAKGRRPNKALSARDAPTASGSIAAGAAGGRPNMLMAAATGSGSQSGCQSGPKS
eukprot:14627345-Alexandrium_andersonii.AAC.1